MKNFFNSLFWKIALIFLFILVVISGVYMYISVNTAERYYQETRQELDYNIAAHIAKDNKCFSGDSVNTGVLKNVFHNVMIINPSIEVYLLDTEGKILTFYAPEAKIKTEKIPLDRIKEFINEKPEGLLTGTDPRNPYKQKPFSAAEVVEDGKHKGYIYVILRSEEYDNAAGVVFGSYIMRLGVRSMIIALFTAAIVGFIAIAVITRNIRRITKVIARFRAGDLTARIHMRGESELAEFAYSYNSMADTIVANMEEIKRMDTSRRELVANVSHDLRTPLSIIRGYIETILIKEDKLSREEINAYLETILASTDRLLKLVEELFQLSSLEARDKAVETEVISITDLFQDVFRKNRIIAEKKEIEMFINLPEKHPMVKADISMMEKVFQNLIDNAIKHTPPGGSVALNIRCCESGNVITEIKDTGSGITEEELPHIFDRYYQVKRVASGESKGIGLGLAIIKRIVELHNFEIIVESRKGEGTCFRITMPEYVNGRS